MAIKKIIAIASAKGGVGKSTIAACLAKVLGNKPTAFKKRKFIDYEYGILY